MIFTQKEFFAFFAIVFFLYWTFQNRKFQNSLLLVASYVFYGWVHPWFVFLIASSTIVDFTVGRAIVNHPQRKKLLLIFSLFFNLGLLGYFKYFNFFVGSFSTALTTLGFNWNFASLDIFLPVGISFYTFQTLSYTIDIYRGRLKPSDSFLDFALFVSFFPQLVAGPIERAKRFLPQISTMRKWSWDTFTEGWQLMIQGFLYKVMVADSIAIFVNKIYMLEKPSIFLLWVGSLAFALQIYADFEGYTQLARGFAKLIGFNLIQNFNSPYLAVSPTDFWRRWHISFSSWIRDYFYFLYVTFGGSKARNAMQFFLLLALSFGFSGLWHGAAWHFVLWGLFHAALIFSYTKLGFGGWWQPSGAAKTWTARIVMFNLTILGWTLFRTPSISWLTNVFRNPDFSLSGELFVSGLAILGLIVLLSLPMLAMRFVNSIQSKTANIKILSYALAIILIMIYSGSGSQDFIYFQF